VLTRFWVLVVLAVTIGLHTSAILIC
jgi:hypothetical protein